MLRPFIFIAITTMFGLKIPVYYLLLGLGPYPVVPGVTLDTAVRKHSWKTQP